MKKIVVAYWKDCELIPYFQNNQTFDYSVEKQAEILNIIIERGFSAMVKPNMGFGDETLLIYISNESFN